MQSTAGEYIDIGKIIGLSITVKGESEYHFVNENVYKIKPGDVVFLPAKEFIDRNYASEMSLVLLSSLCSMSQTNFRRRFCRCSETPQSNSII